MGQLLRPNDFLTKINLKESYLTVPIRIHHQKFLRFIWGDTLWEFACLPLGLASAPHTFSKVLKPVVAQLTKTGIRLIIYLDDMFILAESRDSRRTHHHSSQPVIQPRFCVKQGEVYLGTYTRTRLPRFSGKFNQNVFVPPKGQAKEYQEEVLDYDKQSFRVNQNTVSTSGKTVLFSTSSFPSTPALPLSSDGQNNGFEEKSKLRINTLSEPSSSRRAPVVERSLSCLKWQIPLASNVGWGAY